MPRDDEGIENLTGKQEMIPCGESQTEVVAGRESTPHLYRLGTTSAKLTFRTEVAMSCICSLILIWKVEGREMSGVALSV